MRVIFRSSLQISLPVVIVILGLLNSCADSVQPLDIVIRNAKIIDGTGNPCYRADLGIKDGRIAEIGNLEGRKAGRILDV